MGWESLHYALTHVATGMPFLQRMQRLFQVAATQQQDSCTLVKIRCERGSYIAKQLGFSDSVSAGIYNLDEHWNGRGYPDGLRKQRNPRFLQNRQPRPNVGCFSQLLADREALWTRRRSAAAGGLIQNW